MPVNSDSALGDSSFCIPSLLHIATIISSEKCCSLHEAENFDLLHNAAMDENGPDVRSGKLLKAWREKRNFTLAELAEMVGTTHSVIWLLENGERKLSPKWLYKLGDALSVSPGWLLDHHPDDIPSDIFDIWGKIPAAQHSIASEVLRAFVTQVK